jgi:hypothetical protein
MKEQILTYCLIIATLLQGFQRLTIIVCFQVNQTYIIDNFCENIEKPELHCNGHCHLKKQLTQATEQEQNIPQNLKEITSTFYIQPNFSFYPLQYPQYQVDTPLNGFYLQSMLAVGITDIFHPPAIS